MRKYYGEWSQAGKEYHTYNKIRKAGWIGHILCGKCLLRHFIERKIDVGIEVTGRRESRRKQLLDNLKEGRGYWKLK
jgi:hypothetical protein